jgi:hypothetical protein
MSFDFLAFSVRIDPLVVLGISLWALTLYQSFARLREGIIKGLGIWFNLAERSLYLSDQEFEKTRPARESQNAFWASILSVFPFLLLGGLSYYGITIGLGQSWAISFAVMGAIISSIYDLARRSQGA